MANDGTIVRPYGPGGADVLAGLGRSRLQILQANNFNLQSLRVNGPLMQNEQQLIDQRVIQVATGRLTVVSYLINRGLVLNLDNPLGETEIKYHKAADLAAAKTGMLPIGQHRADAPQNLTPVIVPNPFTWDDFPIDARTLSASRRNGTNLQTTQPARAARKVGDQCEYIMINGGGTYGGNAVYGIVNAPNRSTYTFESNMAWDNASKTGAKILADVQTGLGYATADHMFGPFMLLVPEDYNDALNNDYTTGYPGTIRERLLKMDKIEAIFASGQMPADTIAIVQLTEDVIEVIVGDLGGRRETNPQAPAMPITVVQWEEDGGLNYIFKVMADIVPYIKSDAASQSGIVIGTPS